MAHKVIIADYEYDQIDNEKRICQENGLELVACQCRCEDDVIEKAKDADAILNQYSPITRRVIESLENCKVIATYSIGLDKIDVQAATENGICVANVPDYCVEEVSNHTMAMILSLHRKLGVMDRAVKSNNWSYKVAKPIIRLSEKTIGLVALGKISKLVVKKMKPFCENIIAFDPYLSAEAAAELGVELVELEELLQRSDIVSLHAPLTEETRNMIDINELKMMKETAILINVGRGGLVNEDSLYTALKEGWIAAAGIDVMVNEPPEPNNPLLTLDNIIITPHGAFYSRESQAELQIRPTEEIVRVLVEGRYPKALVNKEVKNKIKLKE
ncbi:MAG: C-terminal binding protein [Halanaerobium sp.]|nr:C-terminal binding protein [Halanaerobium sp.]